MKRLHWKIYGVVIGVLLISLIVLYVPGVAEFIEGRLLGLVAGWAS